MNPPASLYALVEKWRQKAAENSVKSQDLQERLRSGETVICTSETLPQAYAEEHFATELEAALKAWDATIQWMFENKFDTLGSDGIRRHILGLPEEQILGKEANDHTQT